MSFKVTFLGKVGRSAVHYCLLKTGQGRGRVETNSNAKFKSVRFSSVAVKCRSIQESKQTTSDIPTTQHENYAGGKAACSYLHPNAIYVLNELQPSPEHHFCCLVPTTRALGISQEAACEFSDTVMS